MEAYEEVHKPLDDMSIQDLKTAAGNLVKTYPNDLDSNLENEVKISENIV